jgi:tripartite-type tricarboxylate transporter receptor subunit TctC
MKTKTIICLTMLFVSGLVISSYSAGAADYPSRPITLQVPTGAGGPTDTGARILAAIAEKKMGQPIVVVNKVGAGQQVGLTEMARSKPDGYYIGFASLPMLNTMILDPERKTVFNIDSFIPIINQVTDPGIIWSRASSPYKTLKDIIDDAKKRPGVVTASSTGILGDDHMAILMLEKAAGIRFRIVHFNSSAEQMTATLGGHVDVSFDNGGGGVSTREKAGQVRAFAVMDPARSKFMTHIPTTVELGLPTVISNSSRGILGPKGIPGPVVKKIQEVFADAMKNPEHIEKMEQAGLTVDPLVGDAYVKYVRDLHEKCALLMETALKAR